MSSVNDMMNSNFVNPVRVGAAGAKIIASTLNDGLDAGRETAINEAKAIASDAISDAAKSLGLDQLNIVSTVQNLASDMIDIAKQGGSGGIRFESSSSAISSGRGSAGRLDYMADPIEVRLDTGIKPNSYISIYQDSSHFQTYASSLHLHGLRIQFPTSGAAEVNDFFNRVVTFQFLNALQRSVSFSIDSSLITTTNIINSMNAAMAALQVYLFYDSILSYTNVPTNQNDGMLAIRKSLTAENLSDLYELRYLLAGIPIPPNMKTLIYWYSQTYKQDDLTNSAIIKFCPIALSGTGAAFLPDPAQIAIVTNALNSYRSIFALIGRACPSWFDGKLPSSNAMAFHDPNFTTAFANAPVAFSKDAVVENDPKSEYSYRYGTYTEELDGAAFSLQAFWDSANLVWKPSIVNPWTSGYAGYNNNQFSFVNGAFISSVANSALAVNRGQNLNYTNAATGGITFSLPPGSALLEAVYNSTVYETTIKTVQWMMSLDSIGMIPDNRIYNNNNNSRSYKGKSKGKYKGKGK